MRFVTFSHEEKTRIGLLGNGHVLDICAAVSELPSEMTAFLALGDEGLALAANANGATEIPLADVKLEAPVFRPPKILAVGLNYADHIKEAQASGRDLATPEVPMIFNKQSTSANGPGGVVHLPRASSLLDYEGELGFVIGKRCRHVPQDEAHKVIAGYTVANDVSVRDWQMRVPTFTMGKSFDTHCPFGPAIVTPDEVGDPHALDIRTWVNGELRQESNTRELIFNCFVLVEHLSTAFTLEPGDLIITGTPSGVGAVMNPPSFLKAGDVVKVEIEKLGAIENEVIAEPSETVDY